MSHITDPSAGRGARTTSCRACALREKTCFEDMTEQELAFMERFKVGEMVVEAGTTVLLQGSTSPQLFTVLQGLGLRYTTLPNGNRQVLNFAFPGDFIGLQSAVMGELCHSFEASTKMRLCVFDRAGFWELLRHQPRRSFAISWLAAREEHFLGDSLATVGQREAGSKIAWALLRIWQRLDELGELQSSPRGNGLRAPMPWRQQDLADALGMSLVHTNKTLARLRAKDQADWRRGWLTLPDPEALAKEYEITMSEFQKRPLI
ncbi:Crp/Fnr family transcriptional regulator [Rhodobacteraceae bacterium]|nr:Crp/Fnr family transcriptional regulator [Paracoccaceae bacterium]